MNFLAAVIILVFGIPILYMADQQNRQERTVLLLAQAEAKNTAGFNLINQKDTKGAVDKFNEALGLYRQLGNQRFEASTYNNIGTAYKRANQQQALEHYEKALKIQQEIGDKGGAALSLNNIADLYLHTGRAAEAEASYQQAYELWTAVGDEMQQGMTLNNIGRSYVSRNDYKQALDYYNRALSFLRNKENRGMEKAVLENMIQAYDRLAEQGELVSPEVREQTRKRLEEVIRELGN